MQSIFFFVFSIILFPNARNVKAFQDGVVAEYNEVQDHRPYETQRKKRELAAVSEIVSYVTWNITDFLSSGDVLAYNVCINHTSASDAFNVRLRWLFPNNLKFQTSNQTMGPELDTRVYSSYVDLEVSRLNYHERVCCSLMFVFDPDISFFPGRYFITIHTQLAWDDHPISGRRYTSHWDTFSGSIEIPGCSDEVGVGDGYIRDHQMTSSSYISGYEPSKALSNNSDSWCAAVLNDAQYLQIDFIHQVRITKLLVRGKDIYVGVEQFVLEYSLDDKNWRNYSEYGSTVLFNHTLDKDSGTLHWLVEPFKAYSVRFRPTRWNNSICLNLKLYGCEDLETPVSCIMPLGMESGFITDAALSTSLDHGNPHDSRLRKKFKSGGWLASPYISDDYLQIDLAVLYSFTKIAVERQWSETGETNSYVKKYTVAISNDSLVWQNYTENGKLKIFDGPTSSSDLYPTFEKLAEPVVTRYIRIFPKEQAGFRVMRLEVYGCLKEPIPSYSVQDDFSRRSYLLNNVSGEFYVCLYRDERAESSCQYTKDGNSWKNIQYRSKPEYAEKTCSICPRYAAQRTVLFTCAVQLLGSVWSNSKLAQRMVKVLAVDLHDHLTYGLDRSNNYLRRSGTDWIVISLKQWERVMTSSRVVLAREVPENLLRKDHIGGEILESSNGYQWTVSHAGVHRKRHGEDWALVATWKCCNQ